MPLSSSTSSRSTAITVAEKSTTKAPPVSRSPSVQTDSPVQTTAAPDLPPATVVITSQTTTFTAVTSQTDVTPVSTAVITPTDTPSDAPSQIKNVSNMNMAPTSIFKTTATTYVTVFVSSSGSASLHPGTHSSIPLILGAAIGGLAALAILTFIGIYILRKRRRKSESEIEPYPFFAPNAWATHYDWQKDLQSPATSTFTDVPVTVRRPFYDSIGNASYISLPSPRSSDGISLLKRDHVSLQRPLHHNSGSLSLEPGYRDVLTRKMETSSRNSGQVVRQDQIQAPAEDGDPSDSVGGRPPTYRTN